MAAPGILSASQRYAFPQRMGESSPLAREWIIILIGVMAAGPAMLLPRAKALRLKSSTKPRLRGIATVPGWLPAR